MRSIRKENIMEHSEEVAMIANALAVIGNTYFGKAYDAEKIGMVAVFHESPEVITGDLPTPIKYFNSDIKTAYKELEENAVKRLLEMLPTELKEYYSSIILNVSEDDHMVMKWADKLSAYIKCVEELKAGNSEFKKAESSIRKDLEKYHSKEVDFFMENFLPAFELTLDELDNK